MTNSLKPQSLKPQLSLRLLMATVTVVAIATAVGRESLVMGIAIGCAWLAVVLIRMSCRCSKDYLAVAGISVLLSHLSLRVDWPTEHFLNGILRFQLSQVVGAPLPWLKVYDNTRRDHLFSKYEPEYYLSIDWDAAYLSIASCAALAGAIFCMWQIVRGGKPFPWTRRRILGLLIVAFFAAIVALQSLHNVDGTVESATTFGETKKLILLGVMVIGASLFVRRIDFALLSATLAVVTFCVLVPGFRFAAGDPYDIFWYLPLGMWVTYFGIPLCVIPFLPTPAQNNAEPSPGSD